jgi:hypothetical protein
MGKKRQDYIDLDSAFNDGYKLEPVWRIIWEWQRRKARAIGSSFLSNFRVVSRINALARTARWLNPLR